MAVSEMFYISRSKLDQFALSGHRRMLTKASGEISLSPIKVGLEASAESLAGQDMEKLVRVVSAVLASDRYLRDQDADDLADGDWIEFEGRFAYSALAKENHRLLVLAEAPGRGRRRLLLHGSVSNLVLKEAPVSVDTIDLTSSADSISRFALLLAGSDTAEFDVRRRTIVEGVRAIISYLDDVTISRPKLQGWARVTGLVDDGGKREGQLVLASPLFIQFASAESFLGR